jgi:hypothetical protein
MIIALFSNLRSTGTGKFLKSHAKPMETTQVKKKIYQKIISGILFSKKLLT